MYAYSIHASEISSLSKLHEKVVDLLIEMHILISSPVRFRIRFKIVIFVFRAIHGLAPSYLSDLISIRKQSSYNLRSNNELLLVPPPVSFRPTLGGRTFSHAAPV